MIIYHKDYPPLPAAGPKDSDYLKARWIFNDAIVQASEVLPIESKEGDIGREEIEDLKGLGELEQPQY